MPRRQPSRLRAEMLLDRHRCSCSKKVSWFPHMSGRGRLVLASLEHTRLQPGEAREAWEIWAHAVRQPEHRLYARPSPSYLSGSHAYDPGHDLPLPGYVDGPWDCNNPYRAREVLEVVACALPGRDAREFRRRLSALDELW
nr:hypothetical protein GCM10010200_046750 [Actinomadura rugatobispora]